MGAPVIQLLEWWSIPRRGWIIILAELAVIVGLGSWVYSEYVNNTYFQGYVNGLSPILLPIVSVGFGIASATVATLLYFTMRNARQRERLTTEIPRRRSSAKKTVKKTQNSTWKSERAAVAGVPVVSKPRVLKADASGPRRGTAQESMDTNDESD